jgi:hypothetical protein
MATTTNYGWTTPDDTALVKDGAAAIRTLGTSIDTTTKNLNPSTTLGDIEYRSSTANTNTRLGIGSTGQVLTVAGGVPSWATAAGGVSGLTLLNSGGTSLSGSSTTVSGISSKNVVYVYINGVQTNSGTSTIRFRLNGSTTQADYIANINGIQSNPSYSSDFNQQGQQGTNPDGFRAFLASDNTSSVGGGSILILGADTTNVKPCIIQGYATGAGGNYQTATNGTGLFVPASAITSMTVSCNATFTAGTMYVYTTA